MRSLVYGVRGLPVAGVATLVSTVLDVSLDVRTRESGKAHHHAGWPDGSSVDVVDNTVDEDGAHELPEFGDWPVIVMFDDWRDSPLIETALDDRSEFVLLDFEEHD